MLSCACDVIKIAMLRRLLIRKPIAVVRSVVSPAVSRASSVRCVATLSAPAPRVTRAVAATKPAAKATSAVSASSIVRRALSTKTRTGIFGLEVVPNAREVLIDAYTKIIAKAEELGANPFNEYVIKTATHFRSVCLKHTDPNEIEAELEMGQLEDLLEAAENQMDLLVYLNTEATEKPWEADPEGDKEFKECFHPVFGDEEFQSAWAPATPVAPPAAAAAPPK